MKRIPCAVFLCLIVFLAGCGSSEQSADLAAWSCSVTAGDGSDIVYSGQKIASQTGAFTLHNKNDFKITVCLLNGEDENLLNMEPGDITVFDDAVENAEYSVGVSADVEPYTGIALMIYNGSEITYPPGTVIHECS